MNRTVDSSHLEQAQLLSVVDGRAVCRHDAAAAKYLKQRALLEAELDVDGDRWRSRCHGAQECYVAADTRASPERGVEPCCLIKSFLGIEDVAECLERLSPPTMGLRPNRASGYRCLGVFARLLGLAKLEACERGICSGTCHQVCIHWQTLGGQQRYATFIRLARRSPVTAPRRLVAFYLGAGCIFTLLTCHLVLIIPAGNCRCADRIAECGLFLHALLRLTRHR